MARRVTPHLMPVGMTGIPRADAEILRTIESLRVVQFEQDGLWSAGVSFAKSLRNSAEKREGAILEAAIKDAVEQTNHLRLLTANRKLKRIPDVQFEVRDTGWVVALEVKRGVQHDSRTLKSFRDDLIEIPPLLGNALPLFPAENIRFHIVFVFGKLRLKEGLTLDALSKLYGLHAHSHVLTARQRFSAAVEMVMRERGL